jgi:imidazolonepropionase-like amidohydrolase
MMHREILWCVHNFGEMGRAASPRMFEQPVALSPMRTTDAATLSMAQARALFPALVIAPLVAAPLAAQAPQHIAIANVSIVDARSAAPIRNRTVIILGNRILAIVPASAGVPAHTRVIDGRGLYVIPGLWDMHVHTDVPRGRDVLALYVANGVTGVRDMAGGWDTLRSWRAQIAEGTITGPRIVASGPYLEGGETPIPHLLARTAEEGSAMVDSLATMGADLVKVHGRLRPEVFFAILRRARERGLPAAGHVSATIGARAASDSGLRSVEHMLGVPLPCTPAESLALRPRFPVQAAIGRCSSRNLGDTYAAFVRNGTWVTPTLTAVYEVAAWPVRALPGDRYAEFLPDTLRRFVEAIFPMPDSIPAGADSVGGAMLAKRQAQIVAMRRAGVGILAGTDAPLRNAPPGFGLHEELRLLTEGGLSPREALRAATLEPALYLGAADSLGTVEAGKVADLVLLDADPLEDIRNTRRIRGVIVNGRYMDEQALIRARNSARR